jgi:hypothetical protein
MLFGVRLKTLAVAKSSGRRRGNRDSRRIRTRRSVSPGMTDVVAASELLKPYDARLMRSYPISTRINHVANDEECAVPVELTQIQNRLFS